jgi:hypothetical protein
MFETINRDVLILFPKQPLFDWANSVFPKDKMDCPKLMEHDQGNIYLIPETNCPDDAIKYLKKNFKQFFEQQLFEWCIDEETWPEKLTWKLFEEWFHYSVQSMVMDAGISAIIKDEY